MNRAAAFGMGCVLAVLPSLASAAIRINVEDKDVNPSTITNPVPLDVVFTGTDAENEQLFAYDLGFILEKVGGGALGGVGFVTPYAQKPGTGFVFGDQPTDFSVASSPAPSASSFLLNVVNNGTLTDVDNAGGKAATILLNIAQGTAAGVYRVKIDPNLTALASGDPGRPDPSINTDMTDVGTINIVPEPASLSLLAIGGLLALRRRRTA